MSPQFDKPKHCAVMPAEPPYVKYLGEKDGSCRKGLTIGNVYELDLTSKGSSTATAVVKILHDDVGDAHVVLTQSVASVPHIISVGAVAIEGIIDPRDDSWDDTCNMSGIEVVDVEQPLTPEGPESTESLRQHRYTPNLY